MWQYSHGQIVRRFGSIGQDPGKFICPWDVAVSADKHIFVVDGGRLQKFSFSSTYLASYNITSYGVAVHPFSGKVFCTNCTKCNITVLNADLTLSHSFGGKELFTKPHGIAIDTKGMVYVTDTGRGVVLKFTPEGKHNLLLLLAEVESSLISLVSHGVLLLTLMTSCTSLMRTNTRL